jgi:tRNA threonylcarbamoyladenosine biosynthesis protein TsaB
VFLPPKACYALGIPLIAVDTLKILAAQAPVSDGLIIPMIDAREWKYSAIFTSELESKTRNSLKL